MCRNSVSMILAITLWGFAGLVFADSAMEASPRVNCEPLAPTQVPTTEIEGRVQAQVDAFTKKLLGASGELSAKITKRDLLVDIPNADKVLIAKTTAYLFCQSANRSNNLQLLTLFATKVLPALGYENKSTAIIDAPPLFSNGQITLKAWETSTFEAGRIAIAAWPGDRGGVKNKAHAMVQVKYASNKNAEGTETVDFDVNVGQTIKINTGLKRFQLTLLRVDLENNRSTFIVKHL